MGHDPEEDYEAGLFCPTCWGPGKTFGDMDTPKYVRAVFSGISSCPGAPPGCPDGGYILEQSAGCTWQFWEPPLGIAWQCDYGVWNSLLEAFLTTTGQSWFLKATPGCITSFANQWLVTDCHIPPPPHLVIGWGGSGVISWGPEITW